MINRLFGLSSHPSKSQSEALRVNVLFWDRTSKNQNNPGLWVVGLDSSIKGTTPVRWTTRSVSPERGRVPSILVLRRKGVLIVWR